MLLQALAGGAALASGLPRLGHAAEWPRLAVGAGPNGSPFAAYVQALASRAENAEAPKLVLRLTWGSDDNLSLLSSYQVMLGCAGLDAGWQAMTGNGHFALRPFTGLRALLPIAAQPWLLWVKPGITDWHGLEGKRIGIGLPFSRGHAAMFQIASALGIAPEGKSGEFTAQAQQFAAGELDAVFAADAATIHALGLDPAKALSPTLAEIATLAKAIPGLGPLGGEGEPRQIGLWSFLFAQAKLEPAWVEALCRLALQAPLPGGAQAKDALANTGIPFHPGALAALAAAGITPPPVPPTPQPASRPL